MCDASKDVVERVSCLSHGRLLMRRVKRCRDGLAGEVVAGIGTAASDCVGLRGKEIQ